MLRNYTRGRVCLKWHNPYVRTGQFRRGWLWARVVVWRLREGWARLPIGVRFLWLLLGVMLALMTPVLALGYLFLRQSLEAHQQLVQSRRLVAAEGALNRELAALLRQVQDYTVWNDAHTAVQRRDIEWVRRNIVEWLPGQFYYDFAVVVDAEGAWVTHTAGEWEWLRRTAPFQRAIRGIGNAGLHRRGERIYILAAAPIVNEEWSRLPAGVLIVGKAIDETLLRRVSQSAGHTGVLQVQAVANPPSPQPSSPLLRGERAREWGDSNRTSPSTRNLLYDSASRPIAWLQIEPPRAEQS